MFRSIQATRQPSQRVEFYGDEGWKRQIPWLYYEKETGETLRGEPVPNLVASFSLKDTSNKARTDALTYYLARYAMDGTFMGFTELKDQLSLCPLTFDEVKKMRKFGVVSEVSCDIELSQLAVKLDSLQLSSEANTFFELYLSDYEGNLIDVPVLMETFQDSEEEFPNLKFDIDKNRLVHRFFLFDTISGIQNPGGYIAKDKAKIVRYADKVKLTVQLDPNAEERIRKPLLEISYKEYKTNLIDESTKVSVFFSMDFFEEVNNF